VLAEACVEEQEVYSTTLYTQIDNFFSRKKQLCQKLSGKQRIAMSVWNKMNHSFWTSGCKTLAWMMPTLSETGKQKRLKL